MSTFFLSNDERAMMDSNFHLDAPQKPMLRQGKKIDWINSTETFSV